VQAAALDLIGEIPIGHAPVVTTCQTQAFCDLPPSGEMADAALDSIASRFLHVPMLDKKNTMPAAPKAL
jgi:hypothetical protein